MIHAAPIWVLSLLATPGAPAGPTQPSAASFLPIAMLVGVMVFIMLSARSQRKREERDRESMFKRLSKNDRVLTAGGIIGTVITIRDQEVVLKVDETTNTKMTFLKSSVQRILSDDQSVEAKS